MNNKQIGPDTVITKDNLFDVLDYVGLSKSSFIPDDNINPSKIKVKTVAELQKEIEDGKQVPDVTIVEKTVVPNIVTPFKKLAPENGDKEFTVNAASYGGSLYLSTDIPVSDSFTVTRSCSGQYDNNLWTGVTSPNASVSSDLSIYVYRIAPGADLRATWEPTVITMRSYVTVNKYVGIEYGWTLVASQGVQGVDYYYARDYVDYMS